MEYSLRFPGNMVILRDSMRLADTDEVSSKIVDMSQDVGNRISSLLNRLIPGDELSSKYRNMIFMSSVNYPTEYEGTADYGNTLLAGKEQRMAYLKMLIKALKSI
jgi:hypothetical protein